MAGHPAQPRDPVGKPVRRIARGGLMLLALWGAAVAAASAPVLADSPPASEAPSDLQATLAALAERAAPGTLGIVVRDVTTGGSWGVNAGQPFPMMSVFKVPLAATVLAKVDQGGITLDQAVTLTRADLRGGASGIAQAFQGDSMRFSVGDLLAAAVSRSDNTAADALVRLVGGPGVITGYLRDHGITGMRVDLDEGGVERVFSGLGAAAQPPAGETAAQRHQRLWQGYQAFLADPRNRSTPEAAAALLEALWRGRLLSPASTQHLLDLLYAQTRPVRLRAGIPEGVRLADKNGTSLTLRGVTAAFNDIGILTWPDGHTVIIAAFLTASQADRAERESLFADLARATAAALHP